MPREDLEETWPTWLQPQKEVFVRRVIGSEFVSLDGMMEDPRWTFQFSSEEREAAAGASR